MSIWKKVPEKVRVECRCIEEFRVFTEGKIGAIKEKMDPYLKDHSEAIESFIIVGSLGRKEAARTSDVDAFLLFRDGASGPDKTRIKDILMARLRSIVESEDVSLRLASVGAFSDGCDLLELRSNIGGREDTNVSLTRRILLLSEGVGFPEKKFKKIREMILETYLADLQLRDERRPVFLLNDVIRYYRTICVDYEYKKNESGKPWAVRLTKLRHSRKILYFSALLPLLESIDIKKGTDRIVYLKKQFTECTPLERIILLLDKYGKEEHWEILKYYNDFLGWMSDRKMRERLDAVEFEKRDQNAEYLKLRDNARNLREVLNDFIFSVPAWKEPIQKYVLS